MTSNEKFVVAILIVIIIIWVLYTLYKTKYLPTEFLGDIYDDMVYKSNNIRLSDSPEKLRDKIIGHNNDEITKIAFEKTGKRKKANERNKNIGLISGGGINELAVDSFALGEMMRYNMRDTITDDAVIYQYYEDSLNVLSNYPKTCARENTNINHPTPETILYRIEDFYNENPANTTPDFDTIRNNITTARVNNVNNRNIISTYVNNFKNRKRARPRRNPANLTKKERAVDEYFETIDVRSDGQNVHDREVSNEMAEKYNKILELNQFDSMMTTENNYKDYTINDIGKFINNYKFAGDRKNAAELTYSKIRGGGTISKLKNANEEDIAVNVWKRIHSGDNHKNREYLQDAFMDALVDSAPKNHSGVNMPVCVTGRCANMIGSLTLLDKSENLSDGFKTAEIMKNEIFDKSYNILQRELKKASEKTRDMYNGKIAADDTVDKFINHIKSKLETTIKSDYPKADKTVLNNIIEEAKAGI